MEYSHDNLVFIGEPKFDEFHFSYYANNTNQVQIVQSYQQSSTFKWDKLIVPCHRKSPWVWSEPHRYRLLLEDWNK